MSEYFQFWNQDATIQMISLDYGVQVLADEISGAVPDYDKISVPGRNGDLHIPKNRFQNRTRKITVYCESNAKEQFEKLNAILLSTTPGGYGNLESTLDTYTVDEGGITRKYPYRMQALYKGGFFPDKMTPGMDAARAVLVFDCKPEKVLTGYSSGITVAGGGSASFNNPTDFEAYAIVHANGEGRAYIGDTRFDIPDSVGETIVIDSTRMAIYGGGTLNNLTDKVELYHDTFPYLKKGVNTIISSTSTLSIVVYPRVWTL